MSRSLTVFFHENLAGKLTQDEAGRLSFRYDKAYLALENAPYISVSMPLQEAAYGEKIARPYFSGILPDDLARHRLARFLGLSEKNPFSLLEAIGGECAGALTLLPAEQKLPKLSKKDIEPLDDAKLTEMLGLLKQRPLMAGADNIRLSLAGAQDKIAVALENDKICLVHGVTPTTHILKPVISDIEDSVHNEVFCMTLAKKMKIEVPTVFIRWVGATPYYLIERYDRKVMPSGEVKRIHQEDFCQALSIMPHLKYEREGGPSIKSSYDLIDRVSENPGLDRLSFLRRIIFNFLIGNADAHGKNFSLLYKSKAPVLSPAYDLLSTAIYPQLSQKMAMKIGKTYNSEEVLKRYWQMLAPDTKLAQDNLKKIILSMAEDINMHGADLVEHFKVENINSAIFTKIIKTIKLRSENVKKSFIVSPT